MILERINTAAGQNTLLGVIGLCVPGMFLALNGLGAGGLEDLTINSNALTAMYTTFSIMGAFFSGAINNTLGHRLTISLSTLAYILYIGSLWSYNNVLSAELVIAAGALLGLGSSIFWVSQGSIMMSYPLEHEKGNFISVFWVVYNSGAMAGAFFSFGLNYYNEAKSVNSATYASFMGLMIVGLLLSMLVCPINKVTRSDNSPVEVPEHLSLSDHIKGLKEVYTDWRLLTLIPLFMTSNFYYSYEFNTYNGTLFNVRTRSLNNSLYWVMQIIAAPIWGRFLDYPYMSRKKRGVIATGILIVILVTVWGGGYAVQRTYNNDSLPIPLDFMDSHYIGHLFVFMGYGLSDFLVQSTSFWLMGQLSSDPHVLARYTGFYGCIQSAGSAIAWRINAIGIPFMTEYFINISLLGLACLCTLSVIIRLPKSEPPVIESKDCFQSDLTPN